MPDQELSPRRKRLLFRAWHRGTKEADLLVGRFVAENVAAFTEAELDELEAVLELPDVDMTDWLGGRRPVPAEHDGPMMARILAASRLSGAGLPPELRRPATVPKAEARPESGPASEPGPGGAPGATQP